MLVEQIMTTPVVTVRADASPTLAVRLLAERHLTMLPVVDGVGRLVGVVTEADLLALPTPPDPRAHLRPASVAPDGPRPRTVAELATTDPTTTSEHVDVAEVAALFRRSAWKCLPVMRDDRLVGVVSRSDIIRALARDDDDVEDDVNALLAELEPGWRASVSRGVVTVTGAGSDRDADAAASVAATVTGVRGVRVVDTTTARSSAPTGAEALTDLPQSWVCPPSSASGADQL